MSALLEFAERHMVLTWVVVLAVLGLAALTIAVVENIILARLKARAFTEAMRTKNKPDGAP